MNVRLPPKRKEPNDRWEKIESIHKQFNKRYNDHIILSFDDFIHKYVNLFCGVQKFILSFMQHTFEFVTLKFDITFFIQFKTANPLS